MCCMFAYLSGKRDVRQKMQRSFSALTQLRDYSAEEHMRMWLPHYRQERSSALQRIEPS